jgi:hypothetical protein
VRLEHLKESYFFREALLSGGEITAAADQGTDGNVGIDWRSSASQVYSYKIYYLKSGQGTMLVKEVKPNDTVSGAKICTLTGTIYNCHTVIGGLTNDVPYIFKVSVISVNKTESQLSEEKTATPTDKTPPPAPAGLSFSVADSLIKFAWTPAPEASFYRLYHGITTGSYGESFDSEISASGLSFPPNQYSVGKHYFALTAVDKNNNESSKSVELTCNIATKEGCTNLESADCINSSCCLPDCIGKCGGVNSNNNCGRCDGLVGCTADQDTCSNGNCCKYNCVGKCAGETDGCGGTCPNPCNNDQICSAGVCSNKANLRVSADDVHHSYFNGSYLGTSDNWRVPFQAAVPVQSGKNVLAIEGGNLGGYYGISAELIGTGINMNTNSAASWKCVGVFNEGWTNINFDDSSWPRAISCGRIGTSLPYNQIWTSSGQPIKSSDDKTVYCRYTFSLP